MRHNRKLRVGRRDGDIDDLVITGVGVVVVDAKLYPGAGIELRNTGGPVYSTRGQLVMDARGNHTLLAGIASM